MIFRINKTETYLAVIHVENVLKKLVNQGTFVQYAILTQMVTISSVTFVKIV